MVKVERSFPAPKSLAEEAKKDSNADNGNFFDKKYRNENIYQR